MEDEMADFIASRLEEDTNAAIETNFLERQDAIVLWKKGPKKWNQWVAKHRSWGVDLTYFDFAEFAGLEGEEVSFAGYRFPSGNINFRGSKFSGRKIDFSRAVFFGSVVFEDCQFDSEKYDFSRSEFHCGVVFRSTQFGEGQLDFSRAIFGHDIIFDDVTLVGGDAFFYSIQHKSGVFRFNEVKFGDGHVCFKGAGFKGESLDFKSVDFCDGVVSFEGCHFGLPVAFDYSRFGDGELSFEDAIINSRVFSAKRCRFSGVVDFSPNKIASQCDSISFAGSDFQSDLSLRGLSSPVPVDLRNASINRDIDLSGVRMDFKKISLGEKRKIDERNPFRDDVLAVGGSQSWFKPLGFLSCAKHREDSAKFRRLKMIARDGEDHVRALSFYASEVRCGYWHSIRGVDRRLFFFYDLLSNFGQSFLRPVLALFFTVLAFACMYALISSSLFPYSPVLFTDAVLLSLSHTFPFYPAGREMRPIVVSRLFDGIDGVSDLYFILSLAQNILSITLLFFLILALRNLYRS